MGLLDPPHTVGKIHLANGAEQSVLLKQAPVTVHTETQHGLCQIPLTPRSPVLIGMDFLRRFSRMLVISSTLGVHLVPDDPLTR